MLYPELSDVTALPRTDPNLMFMHLVWSDSEMMEFFNRHVLPVVWPGHQTTGLKQEKLCWKPGRNCAAVYELQFDSPAGPCPLRALISFDHGHKLADIHARHYGSNSEISGNGPFANLFLPDHRCMIEFFPGDWKLPSLASAISPSAMLPFLAEAMGSDAQTQNWRCQVSVLRYRPHSRCVLLYEVQANDSCGRREIIGKLFSRASEAEKTFINHQALHEAATEHGLIIPRPLSYVKDLNLVLMDRVHGPSIMELLRTSSKPRRLVSTAAAAIAALHRLPFADGKVRSLKTELKRVRKKAGLLNLVAPESANQIGTILDRIERLADQLDSPKLGVVHGAIRPDHLIVANRDLAFIDLDGAALGDPAIDVADFMAKCLTDTRTLGEDSKAELAEYFLAEYQARANADRNLADRDLADRARVFCSLTFVTRAVRAFLRAPHQNTGTRGPLRSAKLLKEANTWLDRLQQA